MNINSKWIGVSALIGFCGAAAAPAVAAPPPEVPQTTVSYADLDLTREAGNIRLYRRIEVAAHRVCPSGARHDLQSSVRRSSCMAKAIERAVLAVSEPTLTRYYMSKTGKAVASPETVARRQ